MKDAIKLAGGVLLALTAIGALSLSMWGALLSLSETKGDARRVDNPTHIQPQ